jgi:[acyl-carrier-protein] S-malonyltransferase
MGKVLSAANPDIARSYFERADDVLGFALSRLCFEGPEEELVKTENQQPAIFLVSVATNAALCGHNIAPDGVAGHSLGEYSALVAAGALSFNDGLRLTRRRGELMAEVAARTGGIMAAILGLAAEQVEDACREARTLGVAEVANYNSPAQTVISGEQPAVTRAMELCRQRGAQRVIQLNVSAPFHCSLMAPLAAVFAPVLREPAVGDPEVPVVANVTAGYERSADEIRRNLITQLASPVRWTDSMRRLIGDGFDTFIEVGPGKVLTGLMRGINPGVTAHHTNDMASLQRTVEALSHEL